jgi:flagella basal body P-ring formation protein FlgA
MKILLPVVLLVILVFFNTLCFGQQASVIEKRLADMLKEGQETRDMQVKLESIPAHLKQEIRVKSVAIQKMPEIDGKGLAMVEFAGEDGRPRISYVPFRVYEKKTLFYMKRALSKGSAVSEDDLGTKETYISENELIYPKEVRDVVGKLLRKDVAAGTVLTTLILDSPQMVRRGETVTIIGESKQLVVKVKGRAEDSGRVGEKIRVKNLSSDREVIGRVAGNGTVVVEF